MEKKAKLTNEKLTNMLKLAINKIHTEEKIKLQSQRTKS